MDPTPPSKHTPFRYLAFQFLTILIISAFSTSCFYYEADRDIKRGSLPWFCKGTPDLSNAQCLDFATDLSLMALHANKYPTLEDALAAGGSIINTGADRPAVILDFEDLFNFNPGRPTTLIYEGTRMSNRIIGAAFTIMAPNGSAFEGFPGARDVWSVGAPSFLGTPHYINVWMLRPYQNRPNIFAPEHPCLAPGINLGSSSDPCYQAAHPDPFEVLVTSAQGYTARGLDEMVEGLYALPNVQVYVYATASDQSGVGGDFTSDRTFLTQNPGTTLSGRPLTYITSSDLSPPRNGSGSPADVVDTAVFTNKLTPDLIVVGLNQGQVLGPETSNSGHIGAARTGRTLLIPTIAASIGENSNVSPDWATGVSETLELVETFRMGYLSDEIDMLPSLNIPSCLPGLSPRRMQQTVVAVGLAGRDDSVQDCGSTVSTFADDIDVHNNGAVSLSDAGRVVPPNWP